MITAWIAWARALLFPVAEQTSPGVDTSEYERFALPYAFKPQLSFTEALVAVAGALFRILFGSLIFAFWGTYSLLAWSSIPNYFVRFVALLLLLALFLVTFSALMFAISALVRTLSPRRP